MVIQNETSISERRACRLVGLSRTVLHYEPDTQLENELLLARLVELVELVELAGRCRQFGYGNVHHQTAPIHSMRAWHCLLRA